MATITKEQQEKIQKQFTSGACFTSIVNSAYHINVKVNTEAIVITSMLADDNERTIIINMNDVRTAFDKDREQRENDKLAESKNEDSANSAES